MKAYILLAPGFEEIEALTPVDVLRRAGFDVTTVAVAPSAEVEGSHGVTVKADSLIADYTSAALATADWLVLPGGMPGASNLAANDVLTEALRIQADNGHSIAAICASPAVVLAPLGLIDGRKATCYPGFEDSAPGVEWHADNALVESTGKGGSIVTGRGPGAALAWALAIVDTALGTETRDTIASQMIAG